MRHTCNQQRQCHRQLSVDAVKLHRQITKKGTTKSPQCCTGICAKNTTSNGGNITVNVAGSVVSQGDLINGIKNGLATLMRRRAGSQFAVL